ncbi:hypothetical protein JXB02_00990 [Candidatus Woesearchaeota archaeon]|nr:hypothetical protein [Candidatus Woesearchaeota archaeon]
MVNYEKKLCVLALFLASVLMLATAAFAAPVPVDFVEVEVEGVEVAPGDTINLNLDRGMDIDVRVELEATANADNVQLEAFMRGYDHDDLIEDITDVFDVQAGRTYVERLTLTLPDRLDQDGYKLRLMVTDRSNDVVTFEIDITVDAERHLIKIRDVMLNPEYEVMSGRALLASVRLKNYGDSDEKDGVKVQVAIPSLGLAATDYIDEIEADESVTSEEMYLRIPQCTKPGDYDVKVTVTYDDGDETVFATETIHVVEDETCNSAEPDKPTQPSSRTVITVPDTQDVMAGKSAVFPLVISNLGATDKTYAMTVQGLTWGTYTIDPSAVAIVMAGRTSTVYVHVTANADAPAGQQTFLLVVSSGGETEQIPMIANVAAAQEQAPTSVGWDKVKRGLEIGLVVLVVLLVILGLIIGFNKLKGSDEEGEEGAGQTYY